MMAARAVVGQGLASVGVAVTGALIGGGETVEARAESAASAEPETPSEACANLRAEDIALDGFILISAEGEERERETGGAGEGGGTLGTATGKGQEVSRLSDAAARVTELLATPGPETDARGECMDLTHQVTRALIADKGDSNVGGGATTSMSMEEDTFIDDVDEVIMRDERTLRAMSGAPMSRDEVAVIADLACAAVMDPDLRVAFSKSQTVQRALRQHTSRGGLLHADSTMAVHKASQSLRTVVFNMNELLASDLTQNLLTKAGVTDEETPRKDDKEDDLARAIADSVDRAMSGLKAAFGQATSAFLKFARNIRLGGKKTKRRKKLEQTTKKKGKQQEEDRKKKDTLPVVTKAMMDKVIMIAVIVLAVIVFRRLGMRIK